MDKDMEDYLQQIISRLDCREEDKRDVYEEMKGHLLLLREEFLQQGDSEQEASRKAIRAFGDTSTIGDGMQHSIFPYYKFYRACISVVFGSYIFVLFWKLLLERAVYFWVNPNSHNHYFWYPEGSSIWDMFTHNMSVIPFRTTYGYVTRFEHYNLDIILYNTLGNILAFLPLGLLVPLLYMKYRSIGQMMPLVMGMSLAIECIQFMFRIGKFDIDDLILNTVGCMVGYMVYTVLCRLVELVKGNRGRFTSRG